MYKNTDKFVWGYKQFSKVEEQAVNILNKYGDKNIDIYGSFATLVRRGSGKKLPDLDVIIEDESISADILNLETNKVLIKSDITYAKKFNEMVKKDEPKRFIKNVYDQVGRLDIPEKYQDLSNEFIDAKINITYSNGKTAWFCFCADGTIRRIEAALQKEHLRVGRKSVKQALDDFRKVAIKKK